MELWALWQLVKAPFQLMSALTRSERPALLVIGKNIVVLGAACVLAYGLYIRPQVSSTQHVFRSSGNEFWYNLNLKADSGRFQESGFKWDGGFPLNFHWPKTQGQLPFSMSWNGVVTQPRCVILQPDDPRCTAYITDSPAGRSHTPVPVLLRVNPSSGLKQLQLDVSTFCFSPDVCSEIQASFFPHK